MTPVSLKKLIKKETGSVIQQMIEAIGTPVGIQDEHGELLLGDDRDSSLGQYSVKLEDQTYIPHPNLFYLPIFKNCQKTR
jgi:hypothetical protein